MTRGAENTLQTPPRTWFVDYLPITGGNEIEIYVDGEKYTKALYDALDGARRVLMTGLHFDPEFALRRPKGDGSTLVERLRSIAAKGAEIYLLVNQFWCNELDPIRNPLQEVIAMSAHLDWYMPKIADLFTDLKPFPNVHCRTSVHPGFVMATHHQKTVIIDETLCFLGGIDLTAVDGDRWDTNAHVIAETDTAEVRNTKVPEKLWHDVHCKLKGPAVQFVLDNFYARWNHGDLRTVEKSTLRLSTGDYSDHVSIQEDKNRHSFTRIVNPGGVYQRRTPVEEGSPEIHSRSHGIAPGGAQTFDWLDGIKVQIVRSMPAAEYAKQKPPWNYSPDGWERSAKDAYLIGIRAARDYIYLENQWVSDEDIWEELRRAASRNHGNRDFRIIVVIPRDMLQAAGFGANQDLGIFARMQEVAGACARPEQFGAYSLEVTIPVGRRTTFEFDESDGGTRAEIYVHSKILLVDDTWLLIGSANAGGISLEGMRDPRRGFAGDNPDTELSAIVYDKKVVKNLRERLWMEHLGSDVSSLSPPTAADLFRAQAEATFRENPENQTYRVRYATRFNETLRLQSVRDAIANAATIRSNGPMDRATSSVLVPFGSGSRTIWFSLKTISPPPGYRLYYRWQVWQPQKTGRALSWPLLSWSPVGESSGGAEAVASTGADGYGMANVVYLPPTTTAEVTEELGVRSASVRCEVLVLPWGTLPSHLSQSQRSRYCFTKYRSIVIASH